MIKNMVSFSRSGGRSSFGTAAWVSIFFSLSQTYNFLGYNTYPLLSFELLQMTALFGTALLLLYGAVRSLKQEWLFYGFLLCLFFDLHFGFANRPIWEYLRTPRWTEGVRCPLFNYLSGYYLMVAVLKTVSLKLQVMAPINYGLAGVLFLGMAYRCRMVLPKVILKMLVVMTLATVGQFLLHPAQLVQIHGGPKLPPTQQLEGNVYLFILDEHSGLQGIPPLDGQGEKFRQKLIDHYQSRGFELYEGAYSNYFDTHNSIPSLLGQTIFNRNGYGRKIVSNAILEKLLSEGYSIRIYQNEAEDFCGPMSNRLEKCYEYRTNSVGYIRDLSMPKGERLLFLTDSFVEAHKSEILKRILNLYLGLQGRERRTSTGPMSAMKAFEQLRADIPKSKKGTVFFVHVMMPHYPYVYDEDCHVKSIADWKDRDQSGLGNTRQGWRERQSDYLHQAACLDHQMEKIYREIDANGFWDQAAVAVFSDHGSRITLSPATSDSVRHFTQEDWRACFSAFAAMKKPNPPTLAGHLITGPIPLQQILRDFFEITSPREEGEFEAAHKVYLRKDWNSPELLPYELPS